MAVLMQAHQVGSNPFRAWVEKILPWYSPHSERLRNVRSEILARMTGTVLDEAQRVIDRQKLIDDYESADKAAHIQHERLVEAARDDAEQ